jgi:hypothetical protein
VITLPKRHAAKIAAVIAATVIHLRVSCETARLNSGIERKAIKESAIAVSSQRGKSLIADRALVIAPEIAVVGSVMPAFYILFLRAFGDGGGILGIFT